MPGRHHRRHPHVLFLLFWLIPLLDLLVRALVAVAGAAVAAACGRSRAVVVFVGDLDAVVHH